MQSTGYQLDKCTSLAIGVFVKFILIIIQIITFVNSCES